MDVTCRLGLDVGSTTLKVALIDNSGTLLLGRYERHRADIRTTLRTVLENVVSTVENSHPGMKVYASVTGSGGLSVSQLLGLPFVQEVVACAAAVRSRAPSTDVAVELGGEDAKITYFRDGLEQRMNSSCAGGTGAFIDQMASLLNTDAAGLDALAAGALTIHPIAARCGVFAKSDIQPLINEGARREDIAASVLQAVVNQTISGLACGRPIRGTVAFLGGPLHFLPRLRERFIRTLKLKEDQAIVPDEAQLFPALGAAQLARESQAGELRSDFIALTEILERARSEDGGSVVEVRRLAPLFADDAELKDFRERHGRAQVPKRDLASHQGPAFLGVDSGSTTSKLALIDKDGRLLWSFYMNNGGAPLSLISTALETLYSQMPPDSWIARSCSTGYGEALVRDGLKADEGEVETVTHMTAAGRLVPDIQTVLDIGGQDMKFLRIRDGAISSVVLNEACSSGCGSFVETFAHALGFSAQEFTALALRAEHPVDLGSRCTVFMNSRVKQAQKEGAGVGDIAAGLAYSVIQNALRKVIRIQSPDQLGERVIVQGGSFASDAILRAFERVAGREAVRPDISGLMGAYGAALLALRHWDGKSASTLISRQALGTFSYRTEALHCPGCANSCALTVNIFEESGLVRKLVSGNRCERGELAVTGGKAKAAGKPAIEIPNLFDWKYRRVFGYESLPLDKAPRGVVGIPRVLNLYENYPFWHTFFTALGFRVELSPRSSHELYERGMESIPSESVCYPGKLAHGHVQALKDKGIRFIFYPCAPREKKLVERSDNRYNCPVVASYPEVIRNNVEGLRPDRRLKRPTGEIPVDFRAPFLPLGSERRLAERLFEELWDKGLSREEIKVAVRKAWIEQENYRADVRKEGERALALIERYGLHGIVLTGRPYHSDPEVNHGIPQLIHGMGMAVLTEDAIAHLGQPERPLRVLDQWAYHSRLYAAAEFVSRRDDLDLVQLNSFGCGLDAVTTDQVEEILRAAGKVYTCIKIDEQSNLGAARIRLRSLAAAIEEREGSGRRAHAPSPRPPRPIFTDEMRKTYTILAPQMSPIHFRLLEPAFRLSGYNLTLLPDSGLQAQDEGQKAVNNDACYPSILVVGQLMAALKSGRYDPDRTALLITQTGGACRATNYIGFLRKALEDAGLGHIPVISLNASGLESNPGFRLSWTLLKRAFMALIYGDVLMRVLYRVRPYEKEAGSADSLVAEWSRNCEKSLARPSFWRFGRTVTRMVEAFDTLPLRNIPRKPRVGVVGEILVKFHPGANNDIVRTLEREGVEVVMPDLADFLFYCAYNGIYRHSALDGSLRGALLARLAIAGMEVFRAAQTSALVTSERFHPPASIYDLASGVDGIVQLGNAAGEGWFLTAEMAELARSGVDGIACVQPFACLPNHITGKGAIQEMRRRYPHTTVSAIDYDPGASEVNQLNRLKLLVAAARDKHRDADSSQSAPQAANPGQELVG